MSVSRSAGALSYRSAEDTSLPEILLGLIYNSATGQLSAEVIKGSYFKTAVSDKPVSTYERLRFSFLRLASLSLFLQNETAFSRPRRVPLQKSLNESREICRESSASNPLLLSACLVSLFPLVCCAVRPRRPFLLCETLCRRAALYHKR